ncbi:MAG: hypothetical protein L0H96_09930 [Humibacillus sp.]|nr:hypothetical protein [Humibacillus sp.]MDN5777218.1 hypothetical protein [Humibacillus sp.]
MTTHALPTEHPSTPRPVDSSAVSSRTHPTERVGLLALAAPLMLFAHGILQWVDAVTPLGDPGSAAPHTTLEYAAGSIGAVATVLLVASIAAFAWLAAEVLRHPALSRRLSVGNMVVAVVGVVTIAAPLGLLPLGALLVLVGLAPLMRGAETTVAAA